MWSVPCLWFSHFVPCALVCVSNPVPKGIFILFCRRTFKQEVLHAEFKNRGQQGVHSSAANEDSCEYSVKQIETSICVPVSLTVSIEVARG